MAKTSTMIQFGLYALETKRNAAFTFNAGLQPFSSLEDLKSGMVSTRPYITLEPDFWLLDGNFRFLPSNWTQSMVHVGLMSAVMSGADKMFVEPPVLEVTFLEPIDIDGFTLIFSPQTGDYAELFNVTYKAADNSTILSLDRVADATEHSVPDDVSGVKKIIITFNSTNRPFRFLRLTGVEFGELYNFIGDSIRAATVVEESDPLSSELRINTLELELHSPDQAFNMLNPEGIYAGLRDRQPLAVYEIVDDQRIFIGQYFLTTWENTSDTEIRFECVDLVGLMDNIYVRGELWQNTNAATVVEKLLGENGIPYELDQSLTNSQISGWMPGGSIRECLQQVAFAIGAQVDCSRSWGVRIYPTQIAANETVDFEISKSQKIAGQPIALRPQIAGVEVTSHNYVPSTTETRELLNEALPAGQYEILFNEPIHSLSISGGTILESGAGYAKINVASQQTVTLTGKAYSDTMKVFSVTNPDVTSSIKTIVRVKDATLVGPTIAQDCAQRVYDYYMQRFSQKLKLVAPEASVGDCVAIESLYGQTIRGIVEKLEIDLANGMIAKAQVVGVKDE